MFALESHYDLYAQPVGYILHHFFRPRGRSSHGHDSGEFLFRFASFDQLHYRVYGLRRPCVGDHLLHAQRRAVRDPLAYPVLLCIASELSGRLDGLFRMNGHVQHDIVAVLFDLFSVFFEPAAVSDVRHHEHHDLSCKICQEYIRSRSRLPQYESKQRQRSVADDGERCCVSGVFPVAEIHPEQEVEALKDEVQREQPDAQETVLRNVLNAVYGIEPLRAKLDHQCSQPRAYQVEPRSLLHQYVKPCLVIGSGVKAHKGPHAPGYPADEYVRDAEAKRAHALDDASVRPECGEKYLHDQIILESYDQHV